MVDTKKYHGMDLETGRLDRRIFADPDIQRALQMGLGNNHGVSGLFEQDDMDNWRGVTQASLNPIARK
jgi:hypothetical protein